jgi:hypothetical protein
VDTQEWCGQEDHTPDCRGGGHGVGLSVGRIKSVYVFVMFKCTYEMMIESV